MTMKTSYPTADRQMETVSQSGRFRGNGTTTTDNTLNEGLLGMTVVRNGVGDFTVTLDEVGSELLHVDATVWVPTALDQIACPGAYDSSAKTIEIYVFTCSTGAAVDPADDADAWVSLTLKWQNTDIAR